MSAAAVPVEGAAPPAKGKKKLIIIVAAVLLLVLAGGGGGLFYMKKKAAEAAAAEAEADEGDGQAKPKGHAEAKHDAAHPPTFVPLEPFVVNLADKDTERYAQIGVTLEIEDPKFADQLKAYMPAIRNGILMVLAHKNSAELLERKGKKLAAEIMRESVRPLGIELDDPEADDEAAADDGSDKPKADTKKKKKKKKKTAEDESPVKHVHFSNFIIQ